MPFGSAFIELLGPCSCNIDSEISAEREGSRNKYVFCCVGIISLCFVLTLTAPSKKKLH